MNFYLGRCDFCKKLFDVNIKGWTRWGFNYFCSEDCEKDFADAWQKQEDEASGLL